MKEIFVATCVGGILEKEIDGRLHILLQERSKTEAPQESGLLETPAGKMRAGEDVFAALRREVKEETGLHITHIFNEEQAETYAAHGYKTNRVTPFSCTQNMKAGYPIMVLLFRCRVRGTLLSKSDEAQNFQWIAVEALQALLQKEAERFYPMHVSALFKYCNEKTSH